MKKARPKVQQFLLQLHELQEKTRTVAAALGTEVYTKGLTVTVGGGFGGKLGGHLGQLRDKPPGG